VLKGPGDRQGARAGRRPDKTAAARRQRCRAVAGPRSARTIYLLIWHTFAGHTAAVRNARRPRGGRVSPGRRLPLPFQLGTGRAAADLGRTSQGDRDQQAGGPRRRRDGPVREGTAARRDGWCRDVSRPRTTSVTCDGTVTVPGPPSTVPGRPSFRTRPRRGRFARPATGNLVRRVVEFPQVYSFGGAELFTAGASLADASLPGRRSKKRTEASPASVTPCGR
jgi:hypothetical protein